MISKKVERVYEELQENRDPGRKSGEGNEKWVSKYGEEKRKKSSNDLCNLLFPFCDTEGISIYLTLSFLLSQVK